MQRHDHGAFCTPDALEKVLEAFKREVYAQIDCRAQSQRTDDQGEENRAEVDQLAGARHIMGRDMFGPVRGAWDRSEARCWLTRLTIYKIEV